MYETVKEGSTELKIEKSSKISNIFSRGISSEKSIISETGQSFSGT